MCAILVLLVSTTIEISSSANDSSGKQKPGKTSAKTNSTKTVKRPKETDMQNLNALAMRVKVGGTRVVLALAAVRRQLLAEG